MRKNGREYRVLSAYVGRDPVTGRRIQFARADRAELVAEIDRYYAAMRAGVAPGDLRDALSPQEIAEFRAARGEIGADAPHALLDAAAAFARARRELDAAGLADVSVDEAVRRFVEASGGVHETTLEAAFEAYLASFGEAQETYRGIVRSRVGRAVVALGATRNVSSVTPREALAYVEESFGKMSEVTYNNHLGDLKTFFNWCAKPVRAFCKSNPLESAEKRNVAYRRPEYMSPEETQQWLDVLLAGACDERSKALLWRTALGFFTGARTAEIQRIKWKDIDLEGRTMFVAEVKGSQHGAPPRFVKLCDAAMAWLTARPLERGDPDADVFPSRDDTRAVSNALDRVARRHGLKIPKNAARHTFITMHVAAYHDAALTESIVGTSSTMRSGHYQSPVREEEALRYFNEVRPKG